MKATAPNSRKDLWLADDLKVVPQEAAVRQQVRAAARRLAAGLPRHRPLRGDTLEELARRLLEETALAEAHLGFAMVAISNAFWADQFAAVPRPRRFLLLPHCLRDPVRCAGSYDAIGLHCADCGACELGSLKREAEALGYRVLIAEGTPAVVDVVLRGQSDAILGVACLDSLEKAFQRVVELGIPHIALPLVTNGCVSTTAELDVLRAWMHRYARPVAARTRSYVPLLRAAEALFEEGALAHALAGHVKGGLRAAVEPVGEPMTGTEALALDWLRLGGKRFRPFITLASYAAVVHGGAALDPAADLAGAFPPAVERTAVAIEALHKASLVHDDIEDDDVCRYGRQTLHCRYGVPAAINVGDYLIGLGYRLVASGRAELGAPCASDILAHLAEAHVRLCRGQGAELLCRSGPPSALRPLDALTIYTLKTAPAFEAAMYAGLRMAAGSLEDPVPDAASIRAFSRHLGVAYQVLNDLKDWDGDGHDKMVAGQDSLAARPTVLGAFAFEAGDQASREQLLEAMAAELPPQAKVDRLRELYAARGVFERADRLVEKCRQRARVQADRTVPPALRDLMHFVVETVL